MLTRTGSWNGGLQGGQATLLLLELSFQIEIPFEKEREARKEGRRRWGGRVICVPPPLLSFPRSHHVCLEISSALSLCHCERRCRCRRLRCILERWPRLLERQRPQPNGDLHSHVATTNDEARNRSFATPPSIAREEPSRSGNLSPNSVNLLQAEMGDGSQEGSLVANDWQRDHSWRAPKSPCASS